MRREEGKRNKYCLNRSNLFYVEETENKKSSDKKKLLKEQKQYLKNVMNLGMFLLNKTVDLKCSDKMKFSAVLEEV